MYQVTYYRSGKKPEKETYETLDRAMDNARRHGNAKVVHVEGKVKTTMGEWRDYQQVR